jgi:hypothetical protein
MALGRKTGGRRKGTPNKNRGALARKMMAAAEKRGIDVVEDFFEVYDAEDAPDPKRMRMLFALLRYAEIAERATADAEDAKAEAEAEAAETAAKPASSVTNPPPRPMQPIDKEGAFSTVDKPGLSLRAALLASSSLGGVPGHSPLAGLPGGPKLPPSG